MDAKVCGFDDCDNVRNECQYHVRCDCGHFKVTKSKCKNCVKITTGVAEPSVDVKPVDGVKIMKDVYKRTNTNTDEHMYILVCALLTTKGNQAARFRGLRNYVHEISNSGRRWSVPAGNRKNTPMFAFVNWDADLMGIYEIKQWIKRSDGERKYQELARYQWDDEKHKGVTMIDKIGEMKWSTYCNNTLKSEGVPYLYKNPQGKSQRRWDPKNDKHIEFDSSEWVMEKKVLKYLCDHDQVHDSHWKSESECRKVLEQLLGYRFEKTRMDMDGRLLELDGWNEEHRVAFEYQGIQHSKRSHFFHPTKEDFEKQKERDAHKREWCERNGIKVVYVWHHQCDYKSSNDVWEEVVKRELGVLNIQY
jgi:hypothetical protein